MANKKIGKRYRIVESLSDFNRIIELADKHSIFTVEKNADYNLTGCNTANYSFVSIGERYIKITTRYVKDVKDKKGKIRYTDNFDGKYVCTWIFDLAGENKTIVLPSTAYRIGSRYYKPKEIADSDIFSRDKDGHILNKCSPILYYSADYDNSEHRCIIYDLNSAYGSVLRDKIIDTYNMLPPGKIVEGEVGFEVTEDRIFMITKKGTYCDYRFPLIESPYRPFVDRFYGIKKNAPKGSKKREISKQIVNIFAGCIMNHNPFLRAYIVETCNIKIEALIKKYKKIVCMANTDAIYSTEPIEEFEIGEEIGQWKIEWQGENFRQKGMNYQKGEEISYRGVTKCLFKNGWNLLKDPLPDRSNMPYRFIYEDDIITVKENEYYEE